MIRIHADLVLRVLDGFTGRPPAPSAIRWTLDGQACRLIAKADGYYVLLGLTPGEHELVLRGGHYMDERLTVRGDGAGYQELLVTMKPGARYPFGQAVTWLTLRLRHKGKPLPGQRVWIAPRSPQAELRIAQDVIKAGETTGRLFFPESVRAIALPRDLLLLDGARTEVCRLEELEEPCFAAPLRFEHKRSCCLYPAQCHTADDAGVIRAVFREALPLALLAEGQEKPAALELSPGDNEHELAI